MSEYPLQTEDLSVGYKLKGGAKKAVASGLNLALAPGEFVCLLGPNGVGKSTLIRSICGMQSPLFGCIRVSGTDLELMTPRQKARAMSVVLTDSLPAGMFDGYSVVALGRHPHTGWTGRLDDRDKERISWALEAVQAGELANRQVAELSDGERQKLMIARALAQETKIMLLDEPTAFLDLPRRVELMRTLRDLARREGLCILLSTHDLDLALRSADKLWLLGSNGKLRTGMPEQLAFDGEIAGTFASDEVDWDSEQGAFRMHRSTCAKIAVCGGGAAGVWTRRALARIGYKVENSESESSLRIRVGEEGWEVVDRNKVTRCDTLSSLVEHLLHLDHGGERFDHEDW